MSGSVHSNDDALLGRRLAARFEARSTSREPEGLLDAAMARVATTGQRPRWLASERWLPMTTLALRVRPTIRTAWLFAVLAVIIALLLALIVGGSRHGLPSNGRILFGQGGDIYALNNDGTTTNLTAGRESTAGVSFSPDGARAVFFTRTADGSRRLAYITTDNSTPVTVGTPVGFHPTFDDSDIISWASDSTRIAFDSTPSGTKDARGPSRIVVVDVSTGKTTFLPLGSFLAADGPAWSHDGRRLAFRCQTGTGNQDSNGSSVAVGFDGNPHALCIQDATAGSTARLLTHALPDGYDAVGYGNPAWSHDDADVFIDGVSFPGGNAAFRIFRVEIATGTLTQLTNQPLNGYNPFVSPDGTKIAFNDWQGTTGALWVMNPDGTGTRKLGDNVVAGSDQWSPDGQFLLFEHAPSGGRDNSLFEIRPDGTDLRTLMAVPNPTSSDPRTGLTWQARP